MFFELQKNVFSKNEDQKIPGLKAGKDLVMNRVGKVGPRFRTISEKSRSRMKEVVVVE